MDIPINILITGEELKELQRHTWQIAEAFNLDEKIDQYPGQEPITLFRWDVECLLDVIPLALDDTPEEYPDRDSSGYSALKQFYGRLQKAYKN